MERAVRLILLLMLAVFSLVFAANETPQLVHGSPYTIDDYLQIRQAAKAAWSADGSRLIFLTNITGTYQVWSIPAGGGYPLQLTFFDDPIAYVTPSPTDPQRILFAKAENGNEREQLYLMNQNGSTIEKITGPDTAVFNAGIWSRDGRKIAYAANLRDPAFFDIYVLNLLTRQADLVMQKDAYLSPAVFSPDGRYLVVTETESSFNNNLYLVDLFEPKKPVWLTPHSGWATYKEVNWPLGSHAEKGVYLLSDLGREFVKIAFLDVKKRKLEYLDKGKWNTEILTFSQKGDLMAYVMNYGGYSKIVLGNINTKTLLPPPTLPEGLIESIAFGPDGDQLAIQFSSADRPADIYLSNVLTGKATRLTHSSTGGVPTESFVTPQLIEFPTIDEMRLPAFVYLPKNLPANAKVPCLVYVHGGPEEQVRPGFNYLFQYFVNRGYAVFAPNVRGSSGYGKSFLALDNGARRLDSVRDVADAAAFIRENLPQIDTNRLGLIGGSYGGFMVLAGLAEYPDIFTAGVCIVGIANFETFLEHTAPWRRKLREAEYGSLDRDRELLKRISPIHKIDRIRAPLMLIYGRNDPRVPVEEAKQVFDALQARSMPVQLLIYEDEGHGLTKLKNRRDAYPKMAAFFDAYLKKGIQPGELVPPALPQ